MQPRNSPPGFDVPLIQEAHQIAEKFSIQQKDLSKARQVYFNSLAVYAVRFYLKCMKIEAVWEASDSWDFLMQALLDVADLVLPGIGKLECRPVLPEMESIYIPADVSFERVGYIAVQIDRSLRTATLLGFLKTVPMEEESSLNQLQPLEDLPAHLGKVRQAKLSKAPERLSQWFENIFDIDWLSVPLLFSTLGESSAFNTRDSNLLKVDDSESLVTNISRGKLIDLGIQIHSYSLALVLSITVGNIEEIDIVAQVYPTKGLILPKDLQFTVLDDKGEICLETQAREADNWMKLEFDGKFGESFSIKLALRNASITEYFVI